MKKFTLILLTVLMAAACRKVSPDQRIAQISKYFDKTDNTYVEDLQRFDNEKRLDYLTLTIAKELNAADIFTIEHADAQSLVAQFPGRERNRCVIPSSPLRSTIPKPAQWHSARSRPSKT